MYPAPDATKTTAVDRQEVDRKEVLVCILKELFATLQHTAILQLKKTAHILL